MKYRKWKFYVDYRLLNYKLLDCGYLCTKDISKYTSTILKIYYNDGIFLITFI